MLGHIIIVIQCAFKKMDANVKSISDDSRRTGLKTNVQRLNNITENQNKEKK